MKKLLSVLMVLILLSAVLIIFGCTEQLPPEEGFEEDQVIAGQAIANEASYNKVSSCKKELDGNSIFFKGELTFSDKGKNYGPYWDKCYKNKLLEYSCDGNKVARKWVVCPREGECKEGACISPCTDTDEGKNYQKKGTVKGWTAVGQSSSNTDSCVNESTPGASPSDYGKLWEFSCGASGVISVDTHDCADEAKLCLYGACVSEEDLVCSPNSYFCEDKMNVARCSADGLSYTPITDCDDGEICQKGECVNYDLSYYPDLFIKEGKFNGYFVIGENSPALDNLAMIDLTASLKYKNAQGEMVPVEIGNAAKLDSEISDIAAEDLIVIGNACVNSVSAQLLGNPADCLSDFSPKQAKVKLFVQPNDNYALLIAGYGGEEDRLAAKYLAANAESLEGTEILLEGTTLEDIGVTVLQ